MKLERLEKNNPKIKAILTKILKDWKGVKALNKSLSFGRVKYWNWTWKIGKSNHINDSKDSDWKIRNL